MATYSAWVTVDKMAAFAGRQAEIKSELDRPLDRLFDRWRAEIKQKIEFQVSTKHHEHAATINRNVLASWTLTRHLDQDAIQFVDRGYRWQSLICPQLSEFTLQTALSGERRLTEVFIRSAHCEHTLCADQLFNEFQSSEF